MKIRILGKSVLTKTVTSLSMVILLLTLVPSTYASKPTPVTWHADFTFFFDTFRTAGGNGIFTGHNTGAFSGALAGPSGGLGEGVFHFQSNLVTFHDVETCTCTVAGHSGSLVLVLSLTGPVDSPPFFGHWTIISCTGGLATLHGEGTISGTVQTDGTGLADYVGNIHFDP